MELTFEFEKYRSTGPQTSQDCPAAQIRKGLQLTERRRNHKVGSMPGGRGSAAGRAAAVRRVLIILLMANLVVVVIKFLVGLGTGSLAVLGDAAHSSVDALNNVLALAVMSVAARGPDEDHPYGHQKFETLGALAIVAFLSVTAFELVKGAILRLTSGAPTLEVSETHLGLLGLTLIINTAVATYESRQGKLLGSDILLADAAHTKADVFVTLGVLSGVLLAGIGIEWADPVVALLVAGLIVVLAYGIVSRAVPVLVDEYAFPPDAIRTAAEEVDGVVRAYDIRSRGSHERAFAELTIAVERSASVEQAHDIADGVEEHLRRRLRLHETIVHVEPC
jgi:cation diffusion facilitator family transporter